MVLPSAPEPCWILLSTSPTSPQTPRHTHFGDQHWRLTQGKRHICHRLYSVAVLASQPKPKWLGSPQERNMALAILAEPNELRAAVSKLVFVPFRVTISWVCCQKKEKHRLTNSRVELIRLGEYGERHITLLRAPEPFRFWLRLIHLYTATCAQRAKRGRGIPRRTRRRK